MLKYSIGHSNYTLYSSAFYIGTETGTSYECDRENSSLGLPEILEIAAWGFVAQVIQLLKLLQARGFSVLFISYLYPRTSIFISLSAFEESLELSPF